MGKRKVKTLMSKTVARGLQRFLTQLFKFHYPQVMHKLTEGERREINSAGKWLRRVVDDATAQNEERARPDEKKSSTKKVYLNIGVDEDTLYGLSYLLRAFRDYAPITDIGLSRSEIEHIGYADKFLTDFIERYAKKF